MYEYNVFIINIINNNFKKDDINDFINKKKIEIILHLIFKDFMNSLLSINVTKYDKELNNFKTKIKNFIIIKNNFLLLIKTLFLKNVLIIKAKNELKDFKIFNLKLMLH